MSEPIYSAKEALEMSKEGLRKDIRAGIARRTSAGYTNAVLYPHAHIIITELVDLGYRVRKTTVVELVPGGDRAKLGEYIVEW